MGDSYRHDTFDKNVIPNGFSKEVKDTVSGAVHLGWTLYINGGSNMTLEAPESANAPQNKSRIHFSTRRNSGPIQRLRAQIAKYADPMKKGMAQSVAEGVLPRDNIPKPAKVIIEEPKNCPKVKANEEHQRHVWYDDKDVEQVRPFACGGLKITRAAVPPSTPVPTPAAVASKGDRHIVSSAPMMAHRGSGLSYPSETTIERHWSDGSTDYKCVVCDYTSTHRQGVSGHYQTHVRKGEAQATRSQQKKDSLLIADPTYTEPAYTKGYTPRRTRVEALMASLLELGLEAFKTPQELAEAVAKASLQWVHEQSNAGTKFAAEHEELSDADILTRIRSLLDQGEYMEQRERMIQLEEELTDVRSQLTESQARATRAEERFQAFRELVNEEAAADK